MAFTNQLKNMSDFKLQEQIDLLLEAQRNRSSVKAIKSIGVWGCLNTPTLQEEQETIGEENTKTQVVNELQECDDPSELRCEKLTKDMDSSVNRFSRKRKNWVYDAKSERNPRQKKIIKSLRARKRKRGSIRKKIIRHAKKDNTITAFQDQQSYISSHAGIRYSLPTLIYMSVTLGEEYIDEYTI
jgi:hypothetical protein